MYEENKYRVENEFDWQQKVGDYYLTENKNMNFNWKDLSGALVSAVLTAVLAYLTTLTSFIDLNWSQIGFIALVAGIGSIVKQLGTTQSRNFAGAVPVR